MKLIALAGLLFVHLGVFNAVSAQAYLDPATGSVLLGVISALGSAAIILYERVVRSLFSLRKRKKKSTSHSTSHEDILIHCESPTYLPVFEPLLRGLKQEGLDCQVIFSTDIEREAFQTHSNAKLIQVPREKIFSKILGATSPVFVSTTPGLDILQLRRSARFQKSCHLLHGPADIHTYAPFSFDRYDAILCGGAYHAKSLRRLERLRGYGLGQGKRLPETGILYYDEFFRERNGATAATDDHLLLAPTWGKSSLLYHLDFEYLESLSRQYGRLSVRFHPQSRHSDAELVNRVTEWIKRLPNGSIDQSPSSYQAIQSASAMLSDVSGVMVDFKILKPEGELYFFSSAFHFGDKEGHWLKWPPYELAFARKYGAEIRKLEMLRSLKSHRNSMSVADCEVVNLGSAGPVAARFLKEMVAEC